MFTTTSLWAVPFEDRDHNRAAEEHYFMLQVAEAATPARRTAATRTTLLRRLIPTRGQGRFGTA